MVLQTISGCVLLVVTYCSHRNNKSHQWLIEYISSYLQRQDEVVSPKKSFQKSKRSPLLIKMKYAEIHCIEFYRYLALILVSWTIKYRAKLPPPAHPVMVGGLEPSLLLFSPPSLLRSILEVWNEMYTLARFDKGFANFYCKEPNNKSFGLCRPFWSLRQLNNLASEAQR